MIAFVCVSTYSQTSLSPSTAGTRRLPLFSENVFAALGGAAYCFQSNRPALYGLITLSRATQHVCQTGLLQVVCNRK